MESKLEYEDPAHSLAMEIYHVVSTVQSVVHGLQTRQMQGNPDWLRIQVGTRGKKGTKAPKHTVRDYIIYRHAKGNFPLQRDTDSIKVSQETKKLMALCPLGFDFTSNVEILQVDHFFNRDAILNRIEEIERNYALQASIKEILISINVVNGSTLERSFIDVLIPVNGPMTALKYIYYNYSANLWPISGSVNATKGSRSAFQFALACSLDELNTIGASLEEAAIAQTQEMLDQFERTTGITHSIIPHILIGDSLQTGLEFFLLTPVGNVARKICTDIAKIGQMGMELAYPLAVQLQRPETHSKAKGMLKAIKITHRVRKKELPHPSDSLDSNVGRDSSSLSSEGVGILEITRDQFSEAIEKSRRKNKQGKIKSQLRDIQSESAELDHGKSNIQDTLSGGARIEEDEWETDDDDNEHSATLNVNKLY